MTLRAPQLPTMSPRMLGALVAIAVALLATACRTPDGPHFPIPEQDLSTAKPEGLTRVVFLNTNYESDNWGMGPIRIQLGGRQLPSVWPERFVQAFFEPGEYDLLLEQSFGFYWKSSDSITIAGDQVLISVYQGGFPIISYPSWEIRDDLPSDFDQAFRPARHPASW